MTTRRDIALSIIADTKRYQAEIAKIPGMTDKAAAKAAQFAVKRKIKEEDQKRKAVEKRIRDETKLAKAAAVTQSAAWRGLAGAVTAGFAGAVMAGRGLLKIGQDVADLRNELADMSVETGISTETLDALRFGAAAAGKSLSQLQMGLGKFSKTIALAARGTGDQALAFKGLGVSLKDDVTGELRSADDILADTLSSLRAVENQTLQTATATLIFGRAGGQLINVAGVLGDDLGKVAAATELVGAGMGSGADQAAKFQRNAALMTQQTDAMKASLMPLALAFAKGLTGGIALARLSLISLKHQFNLTVSLWGELVEAFKDRSGLVGFMDRAREATAANVKEARAELLAEVDAFRLLTGAIKTTSDGLIDETLLSDLLTSAKTKSTAARKKAAMQTSIEYDAIAKLVDQMKAQNEATDLLRAADLELLGEEGKLLAASDKRIAKIAALKAAGAEEATILALQEHEARKLSQAFEELAIREQAAADAAAAAAIEGTLGLEAMKLWIEEDGAGVAAFITETTSSLLGSMGDIAGFAVEDAQKAGKAIKGSIGELKTEISDLESQRDGASDAELKRINQGIRWRQKQIGFEQKQRIKARQDIRKAFKAQKGLQISQAIASGAVGAIRVFADLPYPAALAAAIAVGVATGVSVETIRRQKPPKFFRGISRVEPDEQPAVLHRGEAVLTRRAAATLGRRKIEDLNQGGSSGGAPLGDVVVYLGRELLGRQNMTRGGSHVAVGASSPYMGR